MKRKTILEKRNSEKEVVNVESVIRKDSSSINLMVAEVEDKLITVDDTIESYLKNEKNRMDEQFVALIEGREDLVNRLVTLNAIKEKYL